MPTSSFVQVLEDWLTRVRIEHLITPYIIGANYKRTLLEHDEDFCTTLWILLRPHS